MTIEEIMDRWPSHASFAEDVGVPYQTARFWGRRNYVPAEHIPSVTRAAQRRGFIDVTDNVLTRIAEAQRRNRLQHDTS